MGARGQAQPHQRHVIAVAGWGGHSLASINSPTVASQWRHRVAGCAFLPGHTCLPGCQGTGLPHRCSVAPSHREAPAHAGRYPRAWGATWQSAPSSQEGTVGHLSSPLALSGAR